MQITTICNRDIGILILIGSNTGWERKVHVTPSVDLYSGQILVRSMSGKFQSVYFSDLIIFTLRISASYK